MNVLLRGSEMLLFIIDIYRQPAPRNAQKQKIYEQKVLKQTDIVK